MRIAVCVKQVPDIRAPLEINEMGNGILEEEAYYVTNYSDKVACEEAVRIKEKLGEGQVILITLGPARAERALRDCLTTGADRAILLQNFRYHETDAMIKAEILSKALQLLDVNLILCGSAAEDTQYGAVGVMIAEKLGLPSISDVDKMDVVEDGKVLLAHRKLERGNREIVSCPFPALVTVDPGANKPRYASLPDYIRALTIDIEKWDSSAVGFEMGKSQPKLVSLTPPKPRLKKGFTVDSSLQAEERERMLMAGGLSQRRANFIEGSPQDAAGSLVKYLISNGIIRRTSEAK